MKRSASFVLSLALALCLGITMISADFTPSAESKDVPLVVAPAVDSEELPDNVAPEDIAAVIVNSEDKVYVVNSVLSMISVSDAKNYISDAEDESRDESFLDRCQELIDAYDSIDVSGVVASVAGLDDMADLLGIESPKYTVPYIFELSVDNEDASEALNAEGAYITVVFDVSSFVSEDSKLAVAHIVNEKWVLVPLENTVLDAENGTLTVSFDSLCPIMFISVEESDETEGETGSETEGESATETVSEAVSGSDDAESVETESVETEETVTVPVVTNPVDTDPTETETKPTQTTEPEDSESESETEPDDDDNDDAAMIIVIVCCVIAVIGACAIAFFVLYKKGIIAKRTKKSGDSEKSNNSNGSRKSKKKKSKKKKKNKKNKKYKRSR